MKRKSLLIVILIIPFLKIFSQTNPLDPIIDTCANYSGNAAYNTGEVYVIFTIQNNSIVSKESDEEVKVPTESTNAKNISISPNPVTDILTINTSDKTEVFKIMIYSMDGRKVMEKEIKNNQIDLTSLPIGTYILKTDFNESTNFKLIKL